MFTKKNIVLSLVLGILLAVIGCSGSNIGDKNGVNESISLSSGGASFPYPLYSKWMDIYTQENDVRIDYQSIGSGGGIRGIIDKTFDFAGSDAPMKDSELAKASGEIMHIPTVMGAVVITYNLPGIEEQIKLTADNVADVFLGNIIKWNDKAIQQNNEGVDLPEQDIVVVHRSDGSGTTNTFTDYLNKISEEWKEKVGYGKAVQWPTGVGAKGNEGVAGQVSQIEGSIGYVELAYATENDLSYVSLKNKAGNYVQPFLDTVSQAAAGAVANMPEDMRVSITDSPGEDAWPISTFTYLLVYKQNQDKAKTGEMIDYIWWTLSEGDEYARELLYAPLPSNLLEKVRVKLESITVDGEAVRPSLK